MALIVFPTFQNVIPGEHFSSRRVNRTKEQCFVQNHCCRYVGFCSYKLSTCVTFLSLGANYLQCERWIYHFCASIAEHWYILLFSQTLLGITTVKQTSAPVIRDRIIIQFVSFHRTLSLAGWAYCHFLAHCIGSFYLSSDASLIWWYMEGGYFLRRFFGEHVTSYLLPATG